MKEKFDPSILDVGTVIKKGYGVFVNNVGKATAIITLLVVALVLFTDIGFSDFGTKSFTSTLLVMLMASYLMYFSGENAGERLGEECEEFLNAKKHHRELCNSVKGEMIPALRSFCTEYTKEELKYRRARLLFFFGYSEQEYENYKKGAPLSKKARRAFKKADKIRPISITPKTLLSEERGKSESDLANPGYTRIPKMLLSLLPTTLGMLLTVSVMLTTKENLDGAAIIDGIFKLASLPIIGLRGLAEGYSYVKERLTVWTDSRTRLLERFLAEYTAK